MTLYIVGTPIGNLADITLRALQVLRDVSLIAAEDTRRSQRLLRKYKIATPVTSYFQGNEQKKLETILEALNRGDVALISDAGMPGISDPGYPLIRAAIKRDIPIVPIPGPSAHTAALLASGLPPDRFLFLGFLPRKLKEQRVVLTHIASLHATLICYESPRRLHSTLHALLEVLGDRPIALCRELTKIHEEIWRGDLSSSLEYVQHTPPRGEYTLVIGGAPAPSRWDESHVRTALEAQLAQGVSRSRAAREVAAASGWSRREIYQLTLP